MFKYEKLHYHRKNRRITLEEVATSIGLTKSMLSRIERGNRCLSYDNAVKLALYFDTTPDNLFFNDHLKILKESGQSTDELTKK